MPTRKSKSVDFVALKQQYDDLQPRLDGFRAALTEQISHLIEQEDIVLGSPLQSRVKNWTSISEKIVRLNWSIKSIEKMQDLVGIRLMPLFLRDIKRLRDIIAEHFEVKNEYDTSGRLSHDQFGYASLHMDIALKDAWFSVPTLRAYRGLQAELQIRTLAQHTWAAVSQTLQYKNEESVPPSVRRSISRASALLETLDLEFERVLDERARYQMQLRDDDLPDDAALNVDLLRKILDEKLPAENKTQNEGYADLLIDLNHFEYDTSSKLRALLDKHLDGALAFDAEVAAGEHPQYEMSAGDEDRIQKGIYFAHTGLVRHSLGLEVGEEALQNFILARGE